MVTVAIDEGPLHGPRTGIGTAVAGLLDALGNETGTADVEILPYVVSARARVRAPSRRLPVPALVAHRWWARTRRPRVDRWLGRPDVVHGTNYVVPPTRCPRLVSVYDCWFLEHPDQAIADVARAGDVLRRAVAGGAHVVTSSDASSDRVRDLLGTDDVTTIHLGPPLVAPGDRSDAPDFVPPRLAALERFPFVLALGTVERRKNLPTLVRAFDRLAAEHETVRLVVAGSEGDDTDALAAAIERAAADTRKRIVTTGRVRDDERAWLLDNAAVLAYPSLDEGFGFPVLEAQSVGLPVVASTGGSIPEVAGPGALYGAPHDVDALAANLHLVITTPDRAATLAERGYRNVDRFSWATTASEHAALYHRLAGSVR